jgi:hypothetical protein
MHATEKHAAAFVRIGFFAMAAKRFVVFAFNSQHRNDNSPKWHREKQDRDINLEPHSGAAYLLHH